MYRVHVQETGARRYFGIITAAALLGLTVLMALAVQQQKLLRRQITLGDRIQIEDTPLSFRIPVGWRLLPADQTEPRPSAEFHSGPDAPDKYQLRVAIGQPSEPDAEWLNFQRNFGAMGPAARLDSTRLGPFAAVQLSIGRLACRLAYTPDGRSITFTMGTDIISNSQAARVLDRIAETATWEGPAFVQNAADLRSKTDLTFDVDGPALYQSDPLGATGRLQACSAAGAEITWWLDAWRSPLLEDRSAGDLMDDLILQLGAKGNQKSEKITDDRKARRYHLAADDQFLEFWVIEMDPDDAVVVKLKMQPPASGLADEIFRAVSESLRIGSARADAAVSEARNRARSLVEKVRTQGLSKWWGTQPVRNLYIGWLAARPVRWITETRKPETFDGHPGYDITQVYQLRGRRGNIQRSDVVQWQLDERGQPRPTHPDAPDMILAHGALDVALFLAAQSGRKENLIFYGADPQKPSRWQAVFAQVLSPWTDPDSGETEYRIRIRTDYSPATRVLGFRESGELVRERIGILVFKMAHEDEFEQSRHPRLMMSRTDR